MFQPIEFTSLVFEKDERKKLVSDVRLQCSACGELIEETHKRQMMDDGKWTPENPEHPIPGYRLPSFYSPWLTWIDIVEDFLAAVRAHDKTKLKVVKTTLFAEEWKESIKQPPGGSLYDRREEYPADCEVPMGGAFITSGADVQGDRIEVTFYAWGAGYESWAISHHVLYGDPFKRDDITNRIPVRDAYYNLIARPFKHESGHTLRCVASGADSGFRATDVYKLYANDEKRVYAVKGFGSDEPGAIKGGRATNLEGQKGLQLWKLNAWTLWGQLYGWLDIGLDIPENEAERITGGPGYIHFPKTAEFNRTFFRQLTSYERRQKKQQPGKPVKHEWFKPEHEKAEVHSCRIYATGALAIWLNQKGIADLDRAVAELHKRMEAPPPADGTAPVRKKRQRFKTTKPKREE